MAHFYSSIQGNRGEATRMGSKDSGIESYTASWEGAVRTVLWHDRARGVDMARVTLTEWQGRGSNRLLYEGPVSGKEPDGDKRREAE